MHNSTREAVLSALSRRSRTQAQISEHTHLSKVTVVHALQVLTASGELTVEAGSWPRRYRLSAPTGATVNPRIAPLAAPVIEVEFRDVGPDAIPRWNSSVIGAAIGPINGSEKPRELADKLAVGARSLASMAHALYALANDPEWFQKLSVDTSGSTE